MTEVQTPTTDVEAAARWMLDEIERGGDLYQTDAAGHIWKVFGPHLIYENRNGNPAIDKRVLKAFGALSAGTVVWERR